MDTLNEYQSKPKSILTNEEKAREIAYTHPLSWNISYFSAIEMAQWKDEQFTKEKQQTIEKACEFLKNHTHTRNEGATHCVVSNGETQDDFIDNFKKAMEEI